MDDLGPQGAFELLPEATQRLVRTVDGLDDDALAAPSGLPDWTRAHVVAHLALNAEGLASVLTSRSWNTLSRTCCCNVFRSPTGSMESTRASSGGMAAITESVARSPVVFT